MLPFLSIAGLRVPTFGLCVVVGFLCATYVSLRHVAARNGRHPELVRALAFVVIAGLLGGRLAFALDLVQRDLAAWSELPALLVRPNTGAVHGSVIGGGLATILIVSRSPRGARLSLLDSCAVGVPVGQAIGRLGCLAAGCCWGAPTDGPIAVVYHAHPSFVLGAPLEAALHPLPLYLALGNVLAGACTLAVWRRNTTPGLVVATYFVAEGAIRAPIELLRGESLAHPFAHLPWMTSAHATCMAFVLVGACVALVVTHLESSAHPRAAAEQGEAR